MKRIPTRFTRIPFLLVTLASTLWAQAEPQMPKPDPEHQRLHYFVGNWYTEVETKPGPMDSGGKNTITEHNEMLGDFFVIFHRDERHATGPVKEIGIMGYDPEQKVYTYVQFSDEGERVTATGTVSGDTWVLLWPATDAAKEGGKRLKGRFTLKEVSPTSYTTPPRRRGNPKLCVVSFRLKLSSVWVAHIKRPNFETIHKKSYVRHVTLDIYGRCAIGGNQRLAYKHQRLEYPAVFHEEGSSFCHCGSRHAGVC